MDLQVVNMIQKKNIKKDIKMKNLIIVLAIALMTVTVFAGNTTEVTKTNTNTTANKSNNTEMLAMNMKAHNCHEGHCTTSDKYQKDVFSATLNQEEVEWDYSYNER